MFPLEIRLWSITKHFALAVHRRAFLVLEHFFGLLRFVVWAPIVSARLPRLLRGLDRDMHRPTSRFLGSERILLQYINLPERSDRRREFESELSKFDFVRPVRIIATPDSNGSLGCAKSHVDALTQFLNSSEDVTIICEDDVEFVGSPKEIAAIIDEFESSQLVDVLCLAYRLRGPRLPVSSTMAIGNNIQTTACYVVGRAAAKAVRENFSKSEQLLAAGISPRIASIDIRWKSLQFHPLTFAVPRAPMARQRESYSDIAKRVKRYDP